MESQPASSRPSLSEASRTAVGPVPQFDFHLRILTTSYISFFSERKRIEENYCQQLQKLHHDIKAIDTYLDDRGELTTTRAAWGEIRDNVERETQARSAFLNTLDKDVLGPLTALRETQERTRKRIKEDLKESNNAYAEYADSTLPKLKSRYLKKFAEAEELKHQAAQPVAPTPQQAQSGSPPGSKPNPGVGVRVTSPQPLRPLERRTSLGQGSRNRSPSSGTAFSDLAHQGKRQLNTLMGLLDKSGSVHERGGRETHALRMVRLKREADEADHEYRKGVHWLETLRIRKIKTLESAYRSLEMFIADTSSTVKVVLARYTDNLIATTTTETQITTHAKPMVDKISPERDVQRMTSFIPRAIASATPEQVHYEHGLQGVCSDLIFGISLTDYATGKNIRDGEIPRIVRLCIEEIDKRGLDAEGIYRVSGRHSNVVMLQHEVEKNEQAFRFDPQRDDVYVIASLLKLYLRELPEPLFKFQLQDRIQHTEDLNDHRANNFMLLKAKIRRLPPVHQATLRALVEHLHRVANHSDKNKMDPKNLAIVFGGVVFGEEEIPKGGERDLLTLGTMKDTLMEDMIVHAPLIFDGHEGSISVTTGSAGTSVAGSNSGSQPHSPQLPPTPATDPAPVYYGSKSTKVATVPPQSPHHGHEVDFTPKLPARPANSIHPSSRGQNSPTKDHFDQLPPPPVPPRRPSGNQSVSSLPPGARAPSPLPKSGSPTSQAQPPAQPHGLYALPPGAAPPHPGGDTPPSPASTSALTDTSASVYDEARAHDPRQ
uniref:Rho-GAP domain-containing protein n=1 Tax=Schizophyllum commune (strain H4-8 / FGSC 9210) TaxID=578458 RepID=D8PRV3_SCHCM